MGLGFCVLVCKVCLIIRIFYLVFNVKIRFYKYKYFE